MDDPGPALAYGGRARQRGRRGVWRGDGGSNSFGRGRRPQSSVIVSATRSRGSCHAAEPVLDEEHHLPVLGLVRLAAKDEKCAPGDDIQKLEYADNDIPQLALEELRHANDRRATVGRRRRNRQNRMDFLFYRQPFIDIHLTDYISSLPSKTAPHFPAHF